MRDPAKLKNAAVDDLIEHPVEIDEKAPASIAEGWKARLITTKKGGYLPVVANALIAFRHAPEWSGVLRFNERSLDVVARKAPPWDEKRMVPFNWIDEDDTRVAEWLQLQGIPMGKETAGQAVQAHAREHGYHPVRDYLDGLTWDGIRRIDDWLTLYLGTDPSDYTRAVGAKWLIGAVARIYKPGCKNDTCLILEGPQGILKSTALRSLAEPWFTDDLADLGSKDSQQQIRGVWLIELSELDSMSRGEVSRIKAYMSRQIDRFRPSYGRRVIEAKRECIFAGTVNHTAYLRDESGGRRFWPIRCGLINITDLRRDRNQLWAEARDRFRSGAKWWLEEKALVDAATAEQEQRYDSDPWDELIAKWIRDPKERMDSTGHPVGEMTSTAESVTVADVLTHCIGKRPDTWTQGDKIRIGRCLRTLGWEWYQKRNGKDVESRFRLSSVMHP